VGSLWERRGEHLALRRINQKREKEKINQQMKGEDIVRKAEKATDLIQR
jgi:hypothetical protein